MLELLLLWEIVVDSNRWLNIMNISLTPELEQFVQSTVNNGRYSSASEVVWAALRLLEQREMERLVRLEELRKEIMIGIEASDRGEVFDGEEVLRELREEIQQADEGKKWVDTFWVVIETLRIFF